MDALNLSLLIAVKNNLEYTKNFYETTRKLYPELELCFVSYGSSDGTHDYLFGLCIEDKNVRFYCDMIEMSFSDTYNRALQLATKDYVAFMHNDIILCPNFCENILKHVNEQSVISYTTIEPPIFEGHSRPGKLIAEFGRNVNEIDLEKLFNYAKETQIKYNNQTEEGISFFMCLSRNILLAMGGMDPLFNPFFCEDDDLILRLKLKGLTLKTSLDAICYHFVSKTSRFSEEYKTRTQQIENISNLNFIRKWGFRSSKFNKKYDIGAVITNCTIERIGLYEPWFNCIYVDTNFDEWIKNEQKNTKIDMSLRVKSNTLVPNNNIIVQFDSNDITQERLAFITQIQDVISSTGELGMYRYDIFTIEIKSLDSYEHLYINKSL